MGVITVHKENGQTWSRPSNKTDDYIFNKMPGHELVEVISDEANNFTRVHTTNICSKPSEDECQ